MSFVKRQLLALRCALQFLTTLPVGRGVVPTAELQGLSLLWYPAVGLLLGALLCLVSWLLSLPALLLAAVVLTVWVLLTGALHLDGLADCADAWMAGHGDETRTFSVLKDPACGVMAVVSIVLVLVLKLTSLTVILTSNNVDWLIMVPVLGRLSIFSLFLTQAYVREGGIAAVMVAQFPQTPARVVIIGVLIILFVLLPLEVFLLTTLAVAAVCWWVARSARKRLGGFTGDVAGAQIELVEVVTLLIMALLLGRADAVG
ncbi:MAG: adenosylcobinamide-GDP ribazoletransferase [Pseudomonadota bacterium]